MKNTTHEYGLMAIGVDIQNDFCPGGTLAVPGGDEVVAPFNVLTHQIRKAGGTVVFTRDWHPAQTSHFDNWPPHCIANSPGAAFHSDLNVLKQDTVVSKGTQVDEDAYSGFQGKAQDGMTIEAIMQVQLERHEKLLVAIGGLATDFCVQATVLDALNVRERLGKDRIEIIALRGCMRAVNLAPKDGQRAIERMRAAGAKFELPLGTVL